MEALVLSKVLSGACKDPVFFSRYQSLLHASNLPLGNRDYPDFLTTDITSDDTFGWYCRVCAAFWAACFPKTAYDHSLYFNIEGMVESQMDTVFTGDLVDVKTDDLRLYASILTENYLASAHPNVKQYAVDLISALCLTDGELANELLLREDLMSVEPAELLAAVVEENFSDSPRGREAWHPFALLRSNNDSELNYRIWSAQVRVGYPKIELERLNVVRDYYDQIKHALTIPFANEKTGLPDRFTEHEGDLLLDPYNAGAFFDRLCDACIQMVRHISDHHGLLLFIPEEIDPQAITSVLIVSFGQMALKLSLSAAVSIHFLE